MKTNRIGIDLDGVCYDFHQALFTELTVYNKIDCDYYTFWKNADSYFSPEWWENTCKIAHLYSTQIPSKSLLSCLSDLSYKYEITYITGRPKDVEYTTINYMRKYNFPMYKNIYFSKKKDAVCNSLGIELMVEDQLHYVRQLVEGGINTYVVKQPWNEDHLPVFIQKYPCTVINKLEDMREILL